uniref:Uncharacterized protein n=1 Tax=viral metagenome TaxID=1070528 RepID=A0A6C0K2H9_9ZZZZ
MFSLFHVYSFLVQKVAVPIISFFYPLKDMEFVLKILKSKKKNKRRP